MARHRHERNFDLQDAPQLQPFVLPNVRLTGRTIGEGAYGAVEELEVNGLICAGKKLHAILVRQEYQGAQRMLDRFVEECSLLANLRHPHIVQFLGVCFLDGSDLPVLVMEYLPYCLDALLEGEEKVDIPLTIKYSILCDVLRGLLHLHLCTPPIIHRDLTAKNVLLTGAMTGKLADLGVARILEQQPGRLAVTMTQTPGTMAYMPPEALGKNAKYNTAIDMFSFGHLALYMIVQDFPVPTAPTRPDPDNPGMVIGLTEVQRRSEQMEQLSQQMGGENHPLVQLVTQCLHSNPEQRPSAREVLGQLARTRAEIEDPYADLSRLELIHALKRRVEGDSREDLQAQATLFQDQLQEKQVELEASRAETQVVQATPAKYFHCSKEAASQKSGEGELEAREMELEAIRSETQTKEIEVRRLQSRLQHVEAQWRADVQEYQSRVEQAEGELRQREQDIQELRANQRPQSFTWRKGRDMLFSCTNVQAVVLDRKVYVSGETRDQGNCYTVQVYTPASDSWDWLPRCPVSNFSLAVVRNQLFAVGGQHDGDYVSTIFVWDCATKSWTTPYPYMRTAKIAVCAIGYRQYLVVAGGFCQKFTHSNTVELLNISGKCWSSISPLPDKCSYLSSALVGDTLHLLGGISALKPNKRMFSISLPAVISMLQARSNSPAWQVSDTDLSNSAAVAVNNFLLAVGGQDKKDRSISTIYCYVAKTREWIKVGDISANVQKCACTVLPSGELVVLGGCDVKGSSKSVHIAIVM